MRPVESLKSLHAIFPLLSSVGRAGILLKEGILSVMGSQVASGVFDWLTLWWLVSLTAWSAALLVFHLVRSGRMEVPWLRMVPSEGAGDIETGVPIVRIVDGVLERR